MFGIQQISKEVNQKSKINSIETTKKVLTTFLELAKQKLLQGESISFKNYFTIKRNTTQAKGGKYCNKHEKTLIDYRKANKGKGLTAYTKSTKFRNLVQDMKNCRDCQSKKKQLLKSTKLTNRISFKPSKSFWMVKPSKKK